MLKLLSKLNPRQLIIHFIASWLFIYAVHTLFTLFDYSFLYAKDLPLMSPTLINMKFERDALIATEGGVTGLLIAYLISWKLTHHYKWFWLNSVIILFILFPMVLLDRFGYNQFYHIVMSPGLIFGGNSKPYLISNSIIMLTVGGLLFYLKIIINFINNGLKTKN